MSFSHLFGKRHSMAARPFREAMCCVWERLPGPHTRLSRQDGGQVPVHKSGRTIVATTNGRS